MRGYWVVWVLYCWVGFLWHTKPCVAYDILHPRDTKMFALGHWERSLCLHIEEARGSPFALLPGPGVSSPDRLVIYTSGVAFAFTVNVAHNFVCLFYPFHYLSLQSSDSQYFLWVHLLRCLVDCFFFFFWLGLCSPGWSGIYHVGKNNLSTRLLGPLFPSPGVSGVFHHTQLSCIMTFLNRFHFFLSCSTFSSLWVSSILCHSLLVLWWVTYSRSFFSLIRPYCYSTAENSVSLWWLHLYI